MSKDQSEEKTLPASEKKLRDARKKGQVSQSKDMVISVGTVAILLYIWLGWDRLQNSLTALLVLPHNTYDMPFMEAVDRVVGNSFDLAVATVLPLIVIIITVSILTNVAVMRGFIFSTEPIKPKGDHINPVSGFKKLFSIKNLVELIKSLMKTVLMTAAAVILIWLGLETLIKGPYCGTECISLSFSSIMLPLFIAFALIFIFFAMFDVGIQRWLFLREMRMTQTEMKRERKDMDGDPIIRQELRSQQAEMAQGGGVPLGIKNATVLVVDEPSLAVGICFIQGKTPVPIIVCKGRHERAETLQMEARERSIHVVENGELAANLARTSSLGDTVDEQYFHEVAQVLIEASR